MRKENINKEWLFGRFGQEEMQRIDLPHDAMIHEKRDPNVDNGGATGFLPGGKYVYIKELTGLPEYEGKKLILEFEGIYMDSSVFLNGEQVGGRLYGYSNFFVDITGKLNEGSSALACNWDRSAAGKPAKPIPATPASRNWSGRRRYCCTSSAHLCW